MYWTSSRLEELAELARVRGLPLEQPRERLGLLAQLALEPVERHARTALGSSSTVGERLVAHAAAAVAWRRSRARAVGPPDAAGRPRRRPRPVASRSAASRIQAWRCASRTTTTMRRPPRPSAAATGGRLVERDDSVPAAARRAPPERVLGLAGGDVRARPQLDDERPAVERDVALDLERPPRAATGPPSASGRRRRRRRRPRAERARRAPPPRAAASSGELAVRDRVDERALHAPRPPRRRGRGRSAARRRPPRAPARRSSRRRRSR